MSWNNKGLNLKQSQWLKHYNGFNKENRKNAANRYETYLFKLMYNNLFDKSMENLRNRFKFCDK